MLSRRDAIESVEVRLSALSPLPEGDAWVVYADATQERAFGWVIFYGSRFYRETGDVSHAVAGNAPFLVNRYSGEVEETGTAMPVEHYVTSYEARLARGGHHS